MQSQSRGNTKQMTTEIQNPTNNQNPNDQRTTKRQMPGGPELSWLPAGQGFCSPANQGHTCPQSPATETERDWEKQGERTGMPISQGGA